MDKICAIVPVYEVEKYLGRCIDSILEQSYAQFELVLIDDGSPDRSGQICDDYAKKDPRIHVIHQKNAGVSAARNVGIDYAMAHDFQWITFIDSDDWISPWFFEELLTAAKSTETKVAYGEYIYTDQKASFEEHKESLITVCSPTAWYLDSRDTLLIQSPWCKLFAAELFHEKDFYFPVGIRFEDSATIYKIVFSQEQCVKAGGAIYYYFANSNGFIATESKSVRMQYIDVLYKQTSWFAERGFDEAAGMAANTMLINLCNQYAQIKGQPDQESFIKILRRAVRRLLRKFKRQGGFTVKKNYWYYDVGYPHRMWVYWFVKAQFNKILRKK